MNATAPRRLSSGAFSRHWQIATNGIELAVYEAGQGTPVVLLHGFPELAYSWRNQISPIVDAGFRVIAPDQRGYGSSSAPRDWRSYTVKNLVDDLIGMLDALEIQQAVFFGHDFGSLPAWYSAVYAPERVLGVGSLCAPYSPPGKVDLVEAYNRVRGPNHYMATFQQPGVGEQMLERNVEATFRALMRRRGYTMEQFEASSPAVREIPAGVFIGEPQLFGDELLSDEELEVYVAAFAKTGFTGGLNWYRALHATWAEALEHDFAIEKPALVIFAADDWFFSRKARDGIERLVPRVEKHVIPDAGHWLQQEKPEAVNSLLVSWLRRNF